MERNEISLHEVKTFLALRANKDRWLTNKELAKLVEGVAPRTVRAFTFKFAQMRVVDQAEVFPAHRYRWAEKAEKRNKAYVLRLEQAASVFGLS